MNAKNETPYIHEETTTQPWIKSKAAKITGIAAGGALVLVGTFGAGIAIGSEFGQPHPGIAGFDRDGDHRFPGGHDQRPPRPGDKDGGQFDPNQKPSGAPTTQNG